MLTVISWDAEKSMDPQLVTWRD